MNGNSINSCASNEKLQNNQPSGTMHPPLAGANRRSTTADYSRHWLPLQLAPCAEHRCLLAAQAAHGTIRLAEPPTDLSNSAGRADHCCHRVRADDAAEAMPLNDAAVKKQQAKQIARKGVELNPTRSLRAGASTGTAAMAWLVVGVSAGTGL